MNMMKDQLLTYFFFKKNHYATVSQANQCNITLQLIIFSSLIDVNWVKPQPGLKPGSPAWEVDYKLQGMTKNCKTSCPCHLENVVAHKQMKVSSRYN